MGRRFTRRDHQRPMTAHMVKNPFCNVFASLGSGKTGSLLQALDFLFMTGKLRKGVDRVLICAPLRVAQISWPDEMEKFHWRRLRMACACGTEKQRLAALRSDANIVTINYDVLPWLEQQPEADSFTVSVADEATRLASFRGMQGSAAQAKALAKIVKRNKVKRHINLTATPGGLIKQWGMMWFIDRGAALGKSFGMFEQDFFDKERVGANAFAVKLTPKKHAFKQIMKRMEPYTLTVDAVKIFGVDAPVMLDYWVDLPPKARAVYDKLEQEAFVELQRDQLIDAVNAGAKLGKCLQVAQGACYLTDENGDTSREWAEVHKAKLDALDEIIEKLEGKNVIVVYQYLHDKERILVRYKQARELDKKGEALKQWNAGKLPIMVLHAASAGHGLSLQGDGRAESGGHHLVFFGCGFGVELYQQVCGRVNPLRQKQAGYTDRVVYYHHIRARDTADEAVRQALTDGITTQQAVLDYFESRK